MASTASQTSEKDIVTGGCHCKGVQFQFSKPVQMIVICHCSDCRKSVGATAGDYFCIPRSQLKIINDSTLKVYHSSENAIREFCSNCGCSTGGGYLSGKMKDIAFIGRGTCDSDPGPPVQGGCHYFTREESKAPWDKLPNDGYARCLTFSEGEEDW